MISIDPAKMKVARRLNGTMINGYYGYYGDTTCDGADFLIIAVPHGQPYIACLKRALETAE